MRKQTSKKLRILQIITVAAVVAASWWYAANNWDELRSVSIEEPLWLVPAIGLIIFTVYSIGMLTELAIEPHGPKLKKLEMFGLSSINRFSNYVSPGYLGAVIRSAYLKKAYGLSVAEFSSSFVVSNLVQFLLSGLSIVLLAVVVVENIQDSNRALFIILFLAVAGFMLALFLPLKKLEEFLGRKSEQRNSKLLERLYVATKGFELVRSKPGLLLRIGWWVTLSLVASALLNYVLYQTLGFDVSLWAAAFIAVLSNWSILFSITPGNIGVKEGLMVFAAELAGVTVAGTIILAVLLRILSFIVVGAIALYFAPRLLGKSFFEVKESISEDQ